MNVPIGDSTFDLFMRELRIQTEHLGGLREVKGLFFETKYWIEGDFACSSFFSKRDMIEFISGKIHCSNEREDIKKLASEFIDKIIDKEYRYIRDKTDLKIHKRICGGGTSESGMVEKKILSDNYVVRFYFTTRVINNERPVTMKLLRKIKMSEDEFLETFESKAKWDFGDARIKYTHFDGYVFLEESTSRIIKLDIINKRILDRVSEMLENSPFFISSDNNGKAVAIEQKEILSCLKYFERRDKSSSDFIRSVIGSIFCEKGILPHEHILYYNSKTGVLSPICDKDGH